jgi:hypothetical protein
MLDIKSELEELSALLTRAREIVGSLDDQLPQDTVGWLDMAKTALVQDSLPVRTAPSKGASDGVSGLYSCEFCGAGPFKNELGLQIHQGRNHKKETKARKRATVVA